MASTIVCGFAGEFRDLTTAAYPLGNGYRWYFPGLMRFNAPDAMSPFGAGGANPYAYSSDDPINRSDPSGHASFGILERLFPGRGTPEMGGGGVRSGESMGASIAREPARGRAGAAARHADDNVHHDLPPPYDEPSGHDVPLTHVMPPLPTYHQEVVAPLYGRIKHEIASLADDMGGELNRLYGVHGARRSTPTFGDLIGPYFFNRSKWMELRRRRNEEMATRLNNLDEYRARLIDIKAKINTRVSSVSVLDADPLFKAELVSDYRKLKKVFKTLTY